MYFLYVWTLFTVCRLLSTAQGSLLDDEALVNTLQSSKKTSEEVGEQLQVAEQTEAKIDAAREVGTGHSLLKSLQQAHPHWFFSPCVVWVLPPSTMYTHTPTHPYPHPHTHTHIHTHTHAIGLSSMCTASLHLILCHEWHGPHWSNVPVLAGCLHWAFL